MQVKNIVAYTSRQFKHSERNYLTHNLELAAVIHALVTWRHILLGRKVDVFTDHKSLKYLFTQPNLNLRQKRWLESITEYSVDIQYTPGKANAIADALSHKGDCNNIQVQEIHPDLCEKFCKLNLELVQAGYLNNLVVEPTIHKRIREAQSGSSMIQKIKQGIAALVPKYDCFSVHSDGTMLFEDRAVVPKEGDLREVIMKEAHDSKLSIHPGSTKMYQDLKQTFWWTRMKRDVARYVSQCDVCRRVNTQHRKPAGLLQPLEIPEWKWDHIEMDFVTGFPRSQKGNNAIFIVIDNLSKVAHFFPVKDSISAAQLAELYTARVVSLHGIPRRSALIEAVS